MRFRICALGRILVGSLFIVLELKSQSPSPSPSSAPSSSSSPPPPTTPAPAATPLPLQTAATEVQKIFDIIHGQSGTKDVDLFKIYDQYRSCQDRLVIEIAYRESQFNFDANYWDDETTDEDRWKFRNFMATFLTGCDSTIFYAYHLRNILGQGDSVRGITGILVTSSESGDSNLGLQNNFSDRFSIGYAAEIMKDIIKHAVSGDAKNVCLEIISVFGKNEIEKIFVIIVENSEESETKGWKNDRKKLDAALMLTPLNQCQVVLENFKKDGKDLRQTFEDDFKDDVDKLTAYLQLYDFISLNTTFYSNELYFGLKEKNDIRFPMRVYGSMKQNSDLIAIEKQFTQDHPDIQLREKVKELTNASKGYDVKFFQKVLDKQWADADSSKTPSPSTTPPPSSSSSPIQTSSPSPPLSSSPSLSPSSTSPSPSPSPK